MNSNAKTPSQRLSLVLVLCLLLDGPSVSAKDKNPRLARLAAFAPTHFPAQTNVALMFVHPIKSGGTSVRFAMHHLNEGWSKAGKNFCFRDEGADGKRLRAPGFLEANPRLYFEFHCNPANKLRANSSLWSAREFLQGRGWKVLTATILRDPVPTVPSYYNYFGLGGHNQAALQQSLGASIEEFANARVDFVLCHVWGVGWPCENPLSTSRGSVSRDRAALERATSRFGELPNAVLGDVACRLEGRPPAVLAAFQAFLAELRLRRGSLTDHCGIRNATRPEHKPTLALFPKTFDACTRGPYQALLSVQASWARFVLAARLADRTLCAAHTKELHARLELVDVVGICERWDETFLLIARELGIQKFPRVHINVNRAPAMAADARARLDTVVSGHEACATSLYREWSARFDAHIAKEGSDFWPTLERLRGPKVNASVSVSDHSGREPSS